MLKRIMAALAVSLLMLAGLASPAQAAYTDCPDGYICLFKWVDGGSGRWQASISARQDAGCWNLANSTFGSPALGDPVNNESASLVINPTSAQTGFPRYVRFYDWVNCNSDGDYWTYSGSGYTYVPNLSYGPNPPSGYHKYTSVSVWTPA